MRFGSQAWLSSAVVVAGAIASAALLVALSQTAHAHIRMTYCTNTPTTGLCTPPPPPPPPPSPSPVSSPSPNPNAFLALDVTAGTPATLITVTGSLFQPNQAVSLYWDQPNRVSGAANADASGNFTTQLKSFPGDPPGPHKLCASVAPNPCASFTLQAGAATPSPDVSPSPEPSPSSTPIGVATPARINSGSLGLDVILKPPFVILPIIGGVGLVIALIYWILSIVLRPRPQTLKSVTVGHLASRPDYSAAFGAPPVAPASAEPSPSAWADIAPTNVAPPTDAGAEEAELPPPAPYPPLEGESDVTDDVVATTEPAPEWTGAGSDEPDPLLAAWADVLPPSSRGVEAPPPEDGEGTPGRDTKPPASHDDPLDFPEPGD